MISKYKIQWFLVYSVLYRHHHYLIPEHSITPKGNLLPIISHALFLTSLSFWQPLTYFLSLCGRKKDRFIWAVFNFRITKASIFSLSHFSNSKANQKEEKLTTVNFPVLKFCVKIMSIQNTKTTNLFLTS